MSEGGDGNQTKKSIRKGLIILAAAGAVGLYFNRRKVSLPCLACDEGGLFYKCLPRTGRGSFTCDSMDAGKKGFRAVKEGFITTAQYAGEMGKFATQIPTIMRKVYQNLVPLVKLAYKEVCNNFQTVLKYMTIYLKKGIDKIMHYGKITFAIINKQLIQPLFKATMKFVVKPLKKIYEVCKSYFIKTKNVIQMVLSKIGNGLKNAWFSTENVFDTFMRNITYALNIVPETIGAMIEGIEDAINAVFEALEQGAQKSIGSVVNTTENFLNESKKLTVMGGNRIFENFDSLIHGLGNSISDQVSNLLNQFNSHVIDPLNEQIASSREAQMAIASTMRGLSVGTNILARWRFGFKIRQQDIKQKGLEFIDYGKTTVVLGRILQPLENKIKFPAMGDGIFPRLSTHVPTPYKVRGIPKLAYIDKEKPSKSMGVGSNELKKEAKEQEKLGASSRDDARFEWEPAEEGQDKYEFDQRFQGPSMEQMRHWVFESFGRNLPTREDIEYNTRMEDKAIDEALRSMIDEPLGGIGKKMKKAKKKTKKKAKKTKKVKDVKKVEKVEDVKKIKDVNAKNQSNKVKKDLKKSEKIRDIDEVEKAEKSDEVSKAKKAEKAKHAEKAKYAEEAKRAKEAKDLTMSDVKDGAEFGADIAEDVAKEVYPDAEKIVLEILKRSPLIWIGQKQALLSKEDIETMTMPFPKPELPEPETAEERKARLEKERTEKKEKELRKPTHVLYAENLKPPSIDMTPDVNLDSSGLRTNVKEVNPLRQLRYSMGDIGKAFVKAMDPVIRVLMIALSLCDTILACYLHLFTHVINLNNIKKAMLNSWRYIKIGAKELWDLLYQQVVIPAWTLVKFTWKQTMKYGKIALQEAWKAVKVVWKEARKMFSVVGKQVGKTLKMVGKVTLGTTQYALASFFEHTPPFSWVPANFTTRLLLVVGLALLIKVGAQLSFSFRSFKKLAQVSLAPVLILDKAIEEKVFSTKT
jgi:hypothetical protein